jgi:hypothetical protein
MNMSSNTNRWQPIATSLFFVLVGAGMLWGSSKMVRDGQFRSRGLFGGGHGPILTSAENPIEYWLSVAAISGIAVVMIYVGIRNLVCHLREKSQFKN